MATPPAITDTDSVALRGWIHGRRVCWELEPLVEWDGGRRVQVGYQLRLFGRLSGGLRSDPGGEESEAVHGGLRAIALGVLPTDERASRCEIEPFDAAFHLRPESHWAPEIQLTIRIVHREGYLRPADPDAKALVATIERRLSGLGARRRNWSMALSA